MVYLQAMNKNIFAQQADLEKHFFLRTVTHHPLEHFKINTILKKPFLDSQALSVNRNTNFQDRLL